jgi:hypothetical protein
MHPCGAKDRATHVFERRCLETGVRALDHRQPGLGSTERVDHGLHYYSPGDPGGAERVRIGRRASCEEYGRVLHNGCRPGALARGRGWHPDGGVWLA